jgi:hypothetical protein
MGSMNDPKEMLLKAKWRGLKRRGVVVGWEEFLAGSRLCRSFGEAYDLWVKGGRKSPLTPCVVSHEGQPNAWVWGSKAQVLKRVAVRVKREGLVGVREDGPKDKPFCAYIRKGGKQVRLAKFATAEEAARCYDRHARHVHGPGAQLNYPVPEKE